MSKKKAKIFVAAILGMSMLLGGCGGKKPAEPVVAPETKVEESTAKKEEAPAPEEKVRIRMISGAVGQEFEIAQKLARMYMDKNPNVEVEIFDSPDSATDRLGLYLQFLESKSTEVDVFQTDVIWAGDMADQLIDLNEYGGKAAAAQHFDAIVQNNTVDGRLVMMPYFTDAGLLYYRTDLLEKYNLEVPKTWDDLEKAAKTIQDGERASNPDFWGYVWQGNAYEGLTCNALEWLDSQGGGTIISPDKKITIDNEKAAKALERAKNWVGNISPSGVTAFQEEDARLAFQGGNAAFMRNWPYCYSLAKGDDSAVVGKFDVSPVPQGDGGGAATLGGWQLAVSKYSENPDVAADFVMFMTSKEAQKIRAIEGSFNPTIKDLYSDGEVIAANEFFVSLYDVFMNATPRPSTATAPKYNEVSTIFFKKVHNVLLGQEDAAKAVEELALDLKDATGLEIVK